ncbi:MAG: alpha/beta hydrolase [Anaerohalosphaeraceae bacterium]
MLRYGLLLSVVLLGWTITVFAAEDSVVNTPPASPGWGNFANLAKEVERIQDIQYAEVDGIKLSLDLYRPRQAVQGKLPVVVWIHGGAWLYGSKEQCLPLWMGFVQKGYALASVQYRLTNKAPYPAQIEDCKAAVRWLRAHSDQYNLDTGRFAAWGESAGGHLVALLGTTGDTKEFDKGDNLDQSSAVQAVCDYYGPTSFTGAASMANDENTSKPDSVLYKLFGGPLAEKRDTAAKASPVTFVSKGDAPVLIVHGTKDGLVPLGQSIVFHELLQKAGVDSVYHPIEGANHGGAEFTTPEVIMMIDDFFRKHLSKSDTPLTSPQLSNAPVLKDIPYRTVDDKTLCLDLYRPEQASGKLPVIVWIHGGGWREGSKENCLPARMGFIQKGFAVASVQYRLTDVAIFPAQIEDCKAAIRWLRAHADQYNLDVDRLAAWGGSAGGHLVALLGTTGDVKEFDTGENLDQSSAVQVVCDYYGPTDFTSFVSAKGFEDYAKPDSVVSKLLGGQAQDNPDKAQKASPMAYVSKDDAPMLLVHGDKDTVVPIEQSQMLCEALKKADVPTEFVTLKDAGHGGQQFQTPELVSQIEAFLKSHLDKTKAVTK